MNQEDIVRTARTEVIDKSWGTTQLFLADNRVVLDTMKQPMAARVAYREAQGTYEVYFPIEGESYFLVIVLGPNELKELDVVGSYIEAKIRAYLAISSPSITASQITEKVKLSPTSTHSVGEVLPGREKLQRHKLNEWIYEPQKGLPGSLEEKLEAIVGIIEHSADVIGKLGKDCEVGLNIVYDSWAGDPQFGGIHFDTKTIGILATIGAEIDVDLYATGPVMRIQDE